MKRQLSDRGYGVEKIVNDMVDIYEETEMVDPKDIKKYNARFRMITKIAEMYGLLKRSDD
jgi:DNA repair ATPase RecN